MNKKALKYVIENFNIDEKIISITDMAELKLKEAFEKIDDLSEYNQYKVLKAFQNNKVSDTHFNWTTGYGYDDSGRDIVERVYSEVFESESSLVRTNIVNGTHALAITLQGLLESGDELIYCTGRPYDTLEEVIGLRGDSMGSLLDTGVKYKQIELLDNGNIDIEGTLKAISDKTKVVAIQRSSGYSWRNSIASDQIRELAKKVHDISPEIIVMVDNSYGEFTDFHEPTSFGVDILAGSLIKNPGGGLALSGGYICGNKKLIERVSYRMTCPGIGAECGLTFGQTRAILQGLFIAPKVVNGALKGAMLCGEVYKMLGYETSPAAADGRSDIIQAVKLDNREAVISFCQGIQSSSPIDSHVSPVPSEMPGYDSDIIMAAGTFVQGSSIELSADAPLRAPFNVYFQGGLTYEHAKMGIMKSADNLLKLGYLNKRI